MTVPPHIVIARIYGTFQSFLNQGEDRQSDDSSDISFVLMRADQYAGYARGNRQAMALYTVESSHDQEVQFLLPPTKVQPVKILRGVREPADRQGGQDDRGGLHVDLGILERASECRLLIGIKPGERDPRHSSRLRWRDHRLWA